MPPAVRPPAKSITPPTHLDEIESYLVQTAAGAREPKLIVCKHICMSRMKTRPLGCIVFLASVYLFLYFPHVRIKSLSEKKTKNNNNTFAFGRRHCSRSPGFSPSCAGIICGVIIHPRPHLSDWWSGTSPSFARPPRHHQGVKKP